MRIAVVAGEVSGDLLGGALIRALRKRFPHASFEGVTGPNMREAGCESLATIDALSVMGLAEVLPKLPSILALRRRLLKHLSATRPDVVIGIDAPDFNLTLERKLRERGIKTVHVVSPTIWAWRQGRVKSIARSVDLMLCLFPFEPAFYAAHGVNALYIGHPLAEALEHPISQREARSSLKLPPEGPCLAILPGSRGGELKYLAEPFAETARWLSMRMPALSIIVPIAKPSLRPLMQAALNTRAPGVAVQLIEGQSREVMRAADVVLLASGTATLECLLLDRPMAVAYRVSKLSAAIVRSLNLINIAHFSLPNLLTQEPVVPEFLQEAVRPEAIGPVLLELLSQPGARQRQLDAFAPVRTELKRGAGARAAEAIQGLLESAKG